jgi:hypothetical protein
MRPNPFISKADIGLLLRVWPVELSKTLLLKPRDCFWLVITEDLFPMFVDRLEFAMDAGRHQRDGTNLRQGNGQLDTTLLVGLTTLDR